MKIVHYLCSDTYIYYYHFLYIYLYVFYTWVDILCVVIYIILSIKKITLRQRVVGSIFMLHVKFI